jgi:hypothetical protein
VQQLKSKQWEKTNEVHHRCIRYGRRSNFRSSGRRKVQSAIYPIRTYLLPANSTTPTAVNALCEMPWGLNSLLLSDEGRLYFWLHLNSGPYVLGEAPAPQPLSYRIYIAGILLMLSAICAWAAYRWKVAK